MPVAPSIQVANAMANNPVIAIINSGDTSEKVYTIYLLEYEDGNWSQVSEIYNGVVYTAGANANIDISFLFSDYRYQAIVKRYRAYIDEGGAGEQSADFYVYGGGVSKLSRTFVSNIFATKLDNPNTNFFLTSRTSQRIIPIPENELMYLRFYAGDSVKKKFTIKSGADLIATRDYTSLPYDAETSIDIKTIREQYAATNGKLLSVFDILTDTGYSCTILVTEAQAPTIFSIDFVNSFGAMERIAVYGDADFAPAIETAEAVSVYNQTVNEFIDEPQPASYRMLYNFEAAVISTDNRLFVLDMLIAKYKYLNVGSRTYPCKVTADNVSWTSKPGYVALQVELLYTESSYTPMHEPEAYSTLTTASGDPIQFNDTNIIM